MALRYLFYMHIKVLFEYALSPVLPVWPAWPRSAVGRASGSYVRGPWFDTRSDHILSFLLSLIQEGYLFLLPLIQEGQLSVTGESMCTKYCLTA